MLYLYAVVDRPQQPLSVPRGLGGRPPFLAGERAVAMVASELGEGDLALSEDNLYRHEAVVEALMAERGVLPMRFGCRVRDAASLRQLISIRRDELAAQLERLRGCVEMGLRLWPAGDVASSPPARPRAESGSAYIEHLRLRQRCGDRPRAEAALVDAVHRHLARRARAATRDAPPPPGQALAAAYLVPEEEGEAFVRETAAQRERHRALRFLCTGPWPPYSFASLELGIPVQAGIGDVPG